MTASIDVPAGPYLRVSGTNVQLELAGQTIGGDFTFEQAQATDGTNLVRVVARNVTAGTKGVGCTCFLERRMRPMDDMEGQYYLLLNVVDRPGVLAEIAAVFGDNGVSIRSMWQEGTGEEAQLVFITHRAREGAFQKTVRGLEDLPVVREVRSILRVEGEE